MLAESARQQPQEPGARLAGFALLVLALGVFAMACAHLWRFTVDDAYITLRYARSVAAGLGPVYNATGPRAEGYTSPLWMALLVVPHLLRADAVVTAKVLGVLATLAGAWLARRLATEAGAGSWRPDAAAALYFALPATAVHAVSGMETAFFTMLLTALFAAAARAIRCGRGSPLVPTASLLLGLTRPEGALAAVLVLAVTAWHLTPQERRRLGRWTLLLYALPFTAYAAWRWSYYGLPFPLPFYVKLAHPGTLPGAPDVLAWLQRHALHAGVLALAALAPPPRTLRPAALALAALVAFFLLPQHLMGYQGRYLAPLDPLVCALAAVGLARLALALQRVVPRALATALPLLAFVAMGAWQVRGLDKTFADRLTYADGLAAAHEPLGRELAALQMPGATLALSDGGAVPYLSGWWTLDLIGLNDRDFALTHARDPARVLALAPDVVVLVSRMRETFQPWDWNAYEAPLAHSLASHGYRHVSTRRFADDYWLWVLCRPGSRFAAALGSH